MGLSVERFPFRLHWAHMLGKKDNMKDTKYVMLFVGMVFLFNGEVGAVAHHVLFPGLSCSHDIYKIQIFAT